jgi:hypothetical protein
LRSPETRLTGAPQGISQPAFRLTPHRTDRKINGYPGLRDFLRLRYASGGTTMTRTRFGTRKLRTALVLPALAVVLAGLTSACSFGEVYLHDPFLREVSLAEIQMKYSSLVRWSSFHKAAKYVDPDARDDFLALLPPLETFRFSDYESEPVSIDEVSGEATILVTYKGYSVRSPFEVTVTETQYWKRHSIGNDWYVTPEFEGLEQALGLAKAN